MNIGARIRELRELRKMSQGDVEKKTGLLRCYSSRCENGHTIPALETLQKYANCFGVELYQLFYDKNGGAPSFIKGKVTEELGPKDKHFLEQLAPLVPTLQERDRKQILMLARSMGSGKEA